ncbi:hypothetical protein GJ700_22365 [Duganella sp. FT92W]|uniref:Uncharacterized protein n=1 Tax=Pseudoduganella rivuli TaxID=2666085 RepID=A0A7X2IQR4_9BURK|nr:hypothetical protein [Pseudoduganella rivuli]MRV74457.1 hypothetical protein [Pseudoduganella rivuli]
MKNHIATIAFLSSLAQPACAQEPVRLAIGATTRHMTEIAAGPNRSRLHLVIEGAGRLTLQGATVRFHAQCAIADTVVDKKIVEGVGDCELKSTAGGAVSAHFQTIPGSGERGHLSFSGGSKDFARVDGKVAVDVTVNPARVGKPVFFVESRDGAGD